MFEAMWSILSKGDAVAIFPEGTYQLTHSFCQEKATLSLDKRSGSIGLHSLGTTVFEPKMRPLKTGAARIAVGFCTRTQTPVPIIPGTIRTLQF